MISSKWKKRGWRRSRERGESSTLPAASPKSWGRHPCAGASLKAAGDSSRYQHLAANIRVLVSGKEEAAAAAVFFQAEEIGQHGLWFCAC